MKAWWLPRKGGEVLDLVEAGAETHTFTVSLDDLPDPGPVDMSELDGEGGALEPIELTFTRDPWFTDGHGWLVLVDGRPWWRRALDRLRGRPGRSEVYPVKVNQP